MFLIEAMEPDHLYLHKISLHISTNEYWSALDN